MRPSCAARFATAFLAVFLAAAFFTGGASLGLGCRLALRLGRQCGFLRPPSRWSSWRRSSWPAAFFAVAFFAAAFFAVAFSGGLGGVFFAAAFFAGGPAPRRRRSAGAARRPDRAPGRKSGRGVWSERSLVEHGALLGTEPGPAARRGAVPSVVRRGVRREAFMGGDTLRGCRGAARRSPTAVSGPTGSCHEPWVSAASRSGDNGSPTVPSARSSGPWARRCWTGQRCGSRPAISRSPARTSSGLTDGEPCRKTTSSIAHGVPAGSSGRARRSRERSDRRPGVEACADPSSSSARRAPRRRPATLGGRPRRLATSTPASVIRHRLASSRSASDPPAAGTTSSTSSPSGSASSRCGVDVARVDHLGERRSRGTPPRSPSRSAPRRRRRSAGAG